jgi:hypothetical protein
MAGSYNQVGFVACGAARDWLAYLLSLHVGFRFSPLHFAMSVAVGFRYASATAPNIVV